jgi:hypothetical protein
VLTNNGTTFDPNEVGLTDCSANTAFGKKYEWLLETSQSDSIRLPGTYTADFRAWTADLSGENNTCIRDTSVFVDEDNHDYSEGPKEIVGLNDDNFRCQCDDTDYDLRYFRTDDPNTILATERDICKPTDCGNVTYFTQKVKKDSSSACIGDDRKDRSANLIKVCNADCQRLCLEKSWRGGDNKCFVKESKNRTLGAFLYQNGQCIENPNCGPGTDCPRKTDRPPLGNKSGWNMTTNPIGCPTNQNVIDHTRSRKKQNEIYKKEFTSTDLSSGCVPKNYEYQHNINNAEAAGYCPRDCKYTSSAWSSTCTPSLKQTRTITKHNATDGGNNNNCPAPSVIQNCSIQSQFPLPPTLSLKIKDTNSFEINITENSNGAALLQNPKYHKSVTGPGSPRIDFTNNGLTVARITNCQQNKSYTVRITKKFLNGVPDKHTDITVTTKPFVCVASNYRLLDTAEATYANNSKKSFSSVNTSQLIKEDELCECGTTATYSEKYQLIDPSSCTGPNIKNGPEIRVECAKCIKHDVVEITDGVICALNEKDTIEVIDNKFYNDVRFPNMFQISSYHRTPSWWWFTNGENTTTTPKDFYTQTNILNDDYHSKINFSSKMKIEKGDGNNLYHINIGGKYIRYNPNHITYNNNPSYNNHNIVSLSDTRDSHSEIYIEYSPSYYSNDYLGRNRNKGYGTPSLNYLHAFTLKFKSVNKYIYMDFKNVWGKVFRVDTSLNGDIKKYHFFLFKKKPSLMSHHLGFTYFDMVKP